MATLANLHFLVKQHRLATAHAGDIVSIADVDLLAVGKLSLMYFAFLAAGQQLCARAAGLVLGDISFIAYTSTLYPLVSVLCVAGFTCANRGKFSYLGVTFVTHAEAARALHAVGVCASSTSTTLGELVERRALEANFASICGIFAMFAVGLLARDACTIFAKKEAWLAFGAHLLTAHDFTRQAIGMCRITCFTSLFLLATVQSKSGFAFLASVI